MDVEHAGGAIFEAHGESPLLQFQFLHHVAVEGGARAGDVLALEHVKRHVQQYSVEIQADTAVIGSAQENRASKSLFELTPGRPCTARSGSSASTLARFLASLPASTSVEGLSGARGFEGPAFASTVSVWRKVSGLRMTSNSLISPASR